MTHKTHEIGYAYATSTFAEQVGCGETGCYIIKRITKSNGMPLKSPVLAVLKGFETREQAIAAAENGLGVAVQ